MISTVLPISSLLLGAGILLVGSGLFSTLLAVRGGIEGFSDLTIGLITSGYFVGFLAGTYGCPAIIRRVGHIRAFALFASIASAAPIWHGLIVNPWAWGVLRLATGVCLVGLYTVIESWLNAQSTNEQRGRVFSTYMVVNFMALTAGQFLLLARSPAAFDLFGVITTLFSLSLVPIALTTITQPAPVPAPRPSIRALHAVAPVGVTGSLVSGLVMGAFWGLAPSFAAQLDAGEAGVAAFMSVTILGGAALQWPVGLYSDRHDRRRVLAAVSAGAGVAAVLALFLTHTALPFLLLCMFAYGGLGFSMYSVSVAHLNDRLKPEEVLSGSSGLLLLHGIGAAIGPVLAGVTMGAVGPSGLFVYFAAVLFVFAYATWRSLPARARPEPHPQPFMPMVRTTPTAFEMLPTPDDPPAPQPGQGTPPPSPPA